MKTTISVFKQFTGVWIATVSNTTHCNGDYVGHTKRKALAVARVAVLRQSLSDHSTRWTKKPSVVPEWVREWQRRQSYKPHRYAYEKIRTYVPVKPYRRDEVVSA